MRISINELTEVIERYADMILRIAYQSVKNMHDAEDVCQDVFLKLLEKDRDFENEEHLKEWLIRCAVNKSKDFLKSGWYRNLVHNVVMTYGDGEEKYEADCNVRDNGKYEPECIMNEESEVLREVMALPLKYRSVIYLYYYEEYSVEEIAGILQKNRNTIKTWLSRGRKILEKNSKMKELILKIVIFRFGMEGFYGQKTLLRRD